MSTLTYADRARASKSRLNRRLFEIMEQKKTNVAVSADVRDTESLLGLADSLGPHIAVLKTHIDILKDFDADTINGLKQLADRHDFLIFEDRKFTDIGNTAMMQYDGALQIVDWAHIVNATALAGEGTVEGLMKVGCNDRYNDMRGVLLLAEMTSKGNVATGEYTKRCIEAALAHPDFVMGFVANSSAVARMAGHQTDFVTFTTGVNRADKGDNLGQQYQTPDGAIEGGSDVIIVGRGIYAQKDPVEAAKVYQKEAWEAYERRAGYKSSKILGQEETKCNAQKHSSVAPPRMFFIGPPQKTCINPPTVVPHKRNIAHLKIWKQRLSGLQVYRHEVIIFDFEGSCALRDMTTVTLSIVEA